jgi:uncharacterized coiled-coil protein SlyX
LKQFLLTLTVLLALAAPAMAHEMDQSVSIETANEQIVEVIIPVDATEAELAMLAEKLNAIEPSAE